MQPRRHQRQTQVTRDRRKSREQVMQERSDAEIRAQREREADQRASQRAYCREDLIRLKLLKPKSS